MITDEGRTYIKRYLAGQVGAIAESIVFGAGATAPAATDTVLNFELERVNVRLVAYDFYADKLVFKGTLPEEFSGTVYEIGLYSQTANSAAGAYGSRMLLSFESVDENWSNATWTGTNARFGDEAMMHAPTASASIVGSLTDLLIDISGNSNADNISIAYYVSNANCASITLRFKVDASNYAAYTITSPPAGYNISTLSKGSATITGTMDWGNIAIVDVVTTAKSAGSTQVTYDGVRIEDADTDNPDYVLVAREVLATPYTKAAGTAEEVEFSIGVSI